MLETGSPAPRFSLRDLDGSMKSLDELLAAGPVVLTFFKVSCPVCQFALPFLERMHRKSAESGLQFFAVSQDGAEATRDFCAEFGITFPALLDGGEAGYPVSNGFGISHVPTTFLIEKDGLISWALDGFSKREFENLGRRAGVMPFRRGESVPEWKSG